MASQCGVAVTGHDFVDRVLLGGVSVSIAKTLTAPIERVKLVIQTQDANPRIISGEVQRYTGIVNCFSRIRSEQGLGAFWRGNLTNIIRYFPPPLLRSCFMPVQLFPRYSPATHPWLFFAVNMASGCVAGAVSLCIVYPLDYARTRLASDVGTGKRDFNGLGDCLVKTARGPKGVLGLYTGLGVSAVGIIPFRGMYFGLYELLNRKNPYTKDLGLVGFVAKFFVAQTSAICAGYASYPFDTVRRRLQMQAEKPKEEWVYKGTLDCFSKIVRNEGMRAMFKGAGANLLRAVGAALATVMCDTALPLA